MDETSEFIDAASDDENDDKENDEDLALDGFGAGAERIEEEDDEDDSDSDTEEDLTDGEAEDIQANSDEEFVEDEAEKQASFSFFFSGIFRLYINILYSVKRNILPMNLMKRDKIMTHLLP